MPIFTKNIQFVETLNYFRHYETVVVFICFLTITCGLPEVAQGQVWKVQAPTVDGEPVAFRQMWVNGVKMRRASTFDDWTMPQIITVDKNAKTLTIPRPLMDLSNAKHIEMYIPQDWAVNIMRVTDINHKDAYSSVLSFQAKEADIEFKRPWPILRADYGSRSNRRFYLSNAKGKYSLKVYSRCSGEGAYLFANDAS